MRLFFFPSSQNVLVRGILTIAIGIVLLAVPGLTLKSVIMTVGGMILLGGALNLLFSLSKNSKGINVRTSFQGFFNILWGMLFLIAPMAIVKIFGFFFGIIFLILGLVQFFGAMVTISKSLWSWIYMIFSLMLICGGIFLLAQPIESAEKILKFLGAVFLIYGILELSMAWRLKRMPKSTNAGNTVDTTYEEV
ncbi:MAG: DUF308 domain-containing protein [Prolixibacteraceae bacterium]